MMMITTIIMIIIIIIIITKIVISIKIKTILIRLRYTNNIVQIINEISPFSFPFFLSLSLTPLSLLSLSLPSSLSLFSLFSLFLSVRLQGEGEGGDYEETYFLTD